MATFDPLHAPPGALERGGVEVLRAAIVDGGLHVSLRRAFDDPQAWGMLIADVARHAARIFATETNVTEDQLIQPAMPVNILMPALSPTMEKGNLSKWLKKEGDKVRPGDVLAEIETDKATMEYEAIDEGTLAKIVVPEGTHDVPVNELIAVLAEEGEDPKAAAASAARKPASMSGASATKAPPAAPQVGTGAQQPAM